MMAASLRQISLLALRKGSERSMLDAAKNTTTTMTAQTTRTVVTTESGTLTCFVGAWERVAY